MARSIRLWAVPISLMLAALPIKAEAMVTGGTRLAQPALLPAPGIELVASKKPKKQISAYDACLIIYGERPIRAYYTEGGNKVICYYDESYIGSMKDRRKKRKK